MSSIICHPDNWEAVKAKIDSGYFDKPGSLFTEFRVRTSKNMERDIPTGKYKLPNGKVVAKEEIVVREPFIEYGPEDVEWLVYAGIITEEREMLFYIIHDSKFFASYDFSPTIPSRSVIFSTFF